MTNNTCRVVFKNKRRVTVGSAHETENIGALSRKLEDE